MFDMIAFHPQGLSHQEDIDVITHGQYTGSFFIMLLRNFPSKGFGKLNVCLSPHGQTAIDVGLFPGNVCLSVKKHFGRKNEYFSAGSREKCFILLDEIIETLEFAAGYYGWDAAELHKAYSLCRALDFRYEFLYGPVKSSPDRKLKACVGGFMSPVTCTVLIKIISAGTGGCVHQARIGEISAMHRESLMGAFGRRGWLNNDEFYLMERGDCRQFIVTVSGKACRLVEHPRDKKKLLTAAFYLPRPALINYPEQIAALLSNERSDILPSPGPEKHTTRKIKREKENWEEKELAAGMNSIPAPVPWRHFEAIDNFVNTAGSRKIYELRAISNGIAVTLEVSSEVPGTRGGRREMELFLRCHTQVVRSAGIIIAGGNGNPLISMPADNFVFDTRDYPDLGSAWLMLNGVISGKIIIKAAIDKQDYRLYCYLQDGLLLTAIPGTASKNEFWGLTDQSYNTMGSLTVYKRRVWFQQPSNKSPFPY